MDHRSGRSGARRGGEPGERHHGPRTTANLPRFARRLVSHLLRTGVAAGPVALRLVAKARRLVGAFRLGADGIEPGRLVLAGGLAGRTVRSVAGPGAFGG